MLRLSVLVGPGCALPADIDYHAGAVRVDGAIARLAEHVATLARAARASPVQAFADSALPGDAEWTRTTP
ncbi:hypothetical protein, partial [Burkholderia thailandensis]|uniref:hypothetical protein n=1 Tax=Burkholderia thailandensis TaxID=57975 RepID=UPI0035C77126